jgi:glycosyltransferase involved in cell wall biosynthesis
MLEALNNRTRKILHINTVVDRGGAAQNIWGMREALNKAGEFLIYFAFGRGRKPNCNEVFRIAWKPEVYLHAFLTRITGLHGYGSYSSTRRLEKFILKEKFDLIHLHNLHGYYLNLSFVKFLERQNTPIVWTLHDGWPLTGRCAYLFECDRWQAGCGNCPSLSWYPKTYFDSSSFMWKKKREYFTSGWNPVIVCPSQWLADKVKQSYLNRFRIKVIPNSIDTDVFKPKDKTKIREKLAINRDQKVILFVATDLADEKKGARYFFRSLKWIRADNWILVTIGKKINLNGMLETTSKVKQLGYIRDKNVLSDIYNAADVFCITSLDENFPTTVLESLACGVGIVGFNVGGIAEQVTEDCGILVEPKNTMALGKALEQVITDGEIRDKFRANCRKRTLENYSIDKFRERYINLYKEFLA